MAQRATGFAKKPSAVKASRAPDPARDLDDAPIVLRTIPLELAKLVSPYKKHGRLSLRIEGLPPLSRLSAGRNNGDNSWSLGLDELEDLAFLAPDIFDGPHTLAMRIVAMDGVDATTIAVLEFCVSSDGAAIDAAAATGADPASDLQLLRLREEVARLKGVLSSRDSEIAELQKLRRAESDALNRRLEAGLAEARAAWKEELDARLAEQTANKSGDAENRLAEERARLQREHDAALQKAEKNWKAAEAARLAAAEAQWRKDFEQAEAEAASGRNDRNELRHLRGELAGLHAKLADRDGQLAQAISADELAAARKQAEAALINAKAEWKAGEAARAAAAEAALTKAKAEWLAGESARLSAAETQWRRESEKSAADLAKLKAEWRDAEAARFAAAEAQWKKDSEKALADARAEIEAAVKREARVELRRLHGELAAAHASLAERERALVQAGAAVDQTREGWLEESEAALAKAKAEWQAGEAARLAAAEAQWKKEAEKANADFSAAKAQWKAAEDARFAAAEAQWRKSAENSNGDLDKAKAEWQARETARLAASEEIWRKQSAEALAEITARCERAEAALAQARAQSDAASASGQSEANRLRDHLATAQAAVADRDSMLVQFRLSTDQARERMRQEFEAALAAAKAEWNAGEQGRFAAVEAHWRKQSAAELAEATARYETAESALAQMRMKATASHTHNEETEIGRLRSRVAALQATLQGREAELAEVRSMSILRGYPETKIVLQQDRAQIIDEGAERETRKQSSRRLMRDAIVAALMASSAILIYPSIEEYLPEQLQLDSAPQAAVPAAKTSAPAPAPAAITATITHAANVRSGPSTGASVVVTLPRGADVTIAEQQGNWTRIAATGKDGKPQQGWVYSSFIKKDAMK